VLLERLVVGPDPILGEAAVGSAAGWGRPDLLLGILRRIDGTDAHAPALVPSGIAAAGHLAHDGDRIGLDWLEERTGDPDEHVAALAHARLGVLGWPGCLVELVELLHTASGAALAYALEGAEALATPEVTRALCEVVLSHVDDSGPGLDDNPSDHAIRVLERTTGRSLSADLCGYDEHGNLDVATRRRAALLFGSLDSSVGPVCRVRGGRPLSSADLVADLLDPSPRRIRVAAVQLRSATGVCFGFDTREDLVANHTAVRAWQAAPAAFPDGAFCWQGEVLRQVPTVRGPALGASG
jgi:hypothetical protein